LPRAGLKIGDVVLGLPSSGLHSNGFSLVRRIVALSGLSWEAPAPFDAGRSLAEALLTPTRLYVKPLLEAIAACEGIMAIAHITGGGFPDNLPRVLPEALAVALDLGAFAPPPVFGWLADIGKVEASEMLRAFNCGIGMAVFVAADEVAQAMQALGENGLAPVRLGEIIENGGERVAFRGRLKL
jgi:phosphoribosylformylglycinamidine cyclo-ligase